MTKLVQLFIDAVVFSGISYLVVWELSHVVTITDEQFPWAVMALACWYMGLLHLMCSAKED